MLTPMPGEGPGVEMLAYLRPYLRQCGSSLRPAWRIEGRKLLDFLLVYLDSGQGRFRLDSEWVEVGEGDLFWVPPAVEHEMIGEAPAMGCTYLHFDLIYRPEHSHWDFSIPGGMLELSEFAPLCHPPLPPGPLHALRGRLRGTTNGAVGRLMHTACAIAQMGQPFAGVRAAGVILEIVAELLRGQHGVPPEHSRHIPGLECAAAYLHAQCARPVKLEEAAEVAGLSDSHFRKLFSLHYGCAPRLFLRQCRLQRAKELIMESRLTLTQIADHCGFASVHSFSRAFTEGEGIPPTAYRRFSRPAIRIEGRRAPYAG